MTVGRPHQADPEAIFVGIDGAAPPEYLNIAFTVRPAATYGINSQLIVFPISHNLL